MNCMFSEKLSVKEPRDMTKFLTREQPYINYEEKLLADEVEKDKSSKKYGDEKGRNNDEKEKKGPQNTS
ncbi:hypothetical protein TSUD_55400 [Trifolium subterraneum]|uniref:Uncharacterized protein n=1 Tax=Trifolium subterraneum TaxID=3900 RepID=A0A2Z6M8D2_TRISU|nr:hypothetical protein TSUD_55400 [Trifolium subterraneum]